MPLPAGGHSTPRSILRRLFESRAVEFGRDPSRLWMVDIVVKFVPANERGSSYTYTSLMPKVELF